MDGAAEDIPEHIGIGHAGDGTANDVDCSRSTRGAGHTYDEVGMHIHGGEDHAGEADASRHALVAAFHRACAFRGLHACGVHMGLAPAVDASRLLPLHRLHPFQLDSCRCACQPPFHSTAFVQMSVAVSQEKEAKYFAWDNFEAAQYHY